MLNVGCDARCEWMNRTTRFMCHPHKDLYAEKEDQDENENEGELELELALTSDLDLERECECERDDQVV